MCVGYCKKGEKHQTAGKIRHLLTVCLAKVKKTDILDNFKGISPKMHLFKSSPSQPSHVLRLI